MTASPLRTRRATIEDLDKLRPLWESMRLPVSELEPRLTEFQVAEDAEGIFVGGIGFQLGGSQGRLHNEGFTDFGQADAARELLWKRIQTLSTNHGVLRLWMRESSPFWIRLGFQSPTPDDLKKLPANWNIEGGSWVTLQLKNEDALNAVEKEMAMFMTAEKRHSERTVEQMRTLKTLVTIVAVIIALFVFGAAFYLAMKRPDFLRIGR